MKKVSLEPGKLNTNSSVRPSAQTRAASLLYLTLVDTIYNIEDWQLENEGLFGRGSRDRFSLVRAVVPRSDLMQHRVNFFWQSSSNEYDAVALIWLILKRSCAAVTRGRAQQYKSLEVHSAAQIASTQHLLTVYLA